MNLIQTVAIDKDGDHLHTPREHNTKAEAVAWLNEIKTDRAYFRQLAESDTFPDTIDSLVVIVNGVERIFIEPKFSN